MTDAKARYLLTASLPLDKLRPYPGNARVHNLDAIRESRAANGEYRSIVVQVDDPDQPEAGGTILAGHGNYMTAEKAGDPEIRCELITCSDDTARKIVLADNRTSELGGYDDRLLAELLGDIEDLTGTGYDEQFLDDLTAGLEEGDAIFEHTNAPADDGELKDMTPAKSIEEKEELYAESSTRMLVLTYPVDTFTSIVEKLATLAERHGVDSNADVVEHLVNQATANEG